MELPEDADEKAFDLYESVQVTKPIPETVRIAEDIAMPEEMEMPLPIVILHDDELIHPDGQEPKKFEEKKQKYGRDAKKLYETYQEEWDRLERLGKNRLGSRRKSVLADDASSASSSRLTSPVRSASPRRVTSPGPSASTAQKVAQLASKFQKKNTESPQPVRGRTAGAVQAAKEALERRASHTPSVSPLPKRRFF